MKTFFLVIVCILLLAVGSIGSIMGSILIKEFWDSRRKQSAISKLDGFSLGMLERINGLMFADKYFDPGTIRHLLNLELIKSEVFPSTPITYGYYLTEEGRKILTEKIGRKLYPTIFCDLYNTHWWGGYADKFPEKKREFEKKYKVSYDDSWKRLKELQPDFDRYLYMTPYEKAMKELVKPLLKEIGWLDN